MQTVPSWAHVFCCLVIKHCQHFRGMIKGQGCVLAWPTGRKVSAKRRAHTSSAIWFCCTNTMYRKAMPIQGPSHTSLQSVERISKLPRQLMDRLDDFSAQPCQWKDLNKIGSLSSIAAWPAPSDESMLRLGDLPIFLQSCMC